MKPVGKWSDGRCYGAVVSSSPEDSAYPGGADDDTLKAYGGHLVGESICAAHRETIGALPELIQALILVRDADEDRKLDGLPRMDAPARATIDAALSKAGVDPCPGCAVCMTTQEKKRGHCDACEREKTAHESSFSGGGGG